MKTSLLPVVILHGWNLNGARFKPLVAAFAHAGYRAFAPDLPGFGSEAPPPHAFTLEDYADFVHAFLAKKKIKKCIIVGHSFGGRVGLVVARRYPAVVDRLVLTGVPIFPPVAKTKIRLFLMIAKIGALLFLMPPFSLFERPLKKLLYRIAGSQDYYNASGVMRGTFQLIVKQDLLSVLSMISVPILMIWGAQDQITPLWIAQKANQVKPETKLIVMQHERHMVAVTQPQQFVDEVVSFAKKT